MSTSPSKKQNDAIRGQARFFELLHAGLSSAALRCALKLNIADIINSHNGPMTLSQIAQGIGSPSLNVGGLSRLMRFLVYKQVFDETHQPGHEEPLFALNECSKFLIQDAKNTLAPIAMSFTEPLMFAPFYNLNQAIEEGCTAALKTYGVEVFELFSSNPELNKVFNQSMACRTRFELDAIMSTYDFGSLKGTLVDVGGGIGVILNEIVTKYPHLKGVNFDLPHVVSSAPSYEGVTHVGGNMFQAIPPADSYLIKSILHNWSDDKCIQVLKNCQKSITKRDGKVIIVDIILTPGGNDVFEASRINMDLIMLASFVGGKERTEADWKTVLEEAGFPYYNIIKIPTIVSIIEAYME
ncbi:hypothetical protein E3N88_12434 [Mikania micrantha]|uniref:O-methyltransferase domain-containing protein n=1 Tax=Mikania micrantha TaxID=192012 RepID=A0A5N6P5I0_9ASTR|nr:hypothetical protein E3N88_12434 [Mikania micrantha]